MILLRRSKLLRLVLLLSLIIVNGQTDSTESSGEYLQKVMIELQELNVPSSVAMHNPLTMNLDYQNNEDNTYRKISNNDAQEQLLHQEKYQKLQKPIESSPIDHTDMDQSAANNIVQYYAIRDPAVSKVKQPGPLAYTRAELAALYKKALAKGSTINLSSLMNTLAAGNTPQVTNVGPVRLPVKYPMYNYYFFPLKTFSSELQRDHGYQAMIAPAYQAAETVQSSQKQMMNPLFLAIGTFISMALLFMMGVLFGPKIPNFQLFNARAADDDFQRLMTLIMNAMDRRNILE